MTIKSLQFTKLQSSGVQCGALCVMCLPMLRAILRVMKIYRVQFFGSAASNGFLFQHPFDLYIISLFSNPQGNYTHPLESPQAPTPPGKKTNHQ